jgi:hypothetical protein
LTAGTMLGVLAPVAGSTAAWAGGPQHVTSTFSAEETVPAGELCDFTYHNDFMMTVDALIFADREIDHDVINAAHTNVDTGFKLTETDIFTDFITLDGLTTEVGIQWHLRTASGQVVVVHAGKAVFNPATGEVLSFTPNLNPDFAAVICPALGGHPSPPSP